jgi:hypothetical protein
MLSNLQLNSEEDTVQWCLTKNGRFSTASLYQHCSFSVVLDVRMEEMWQAKLPLKLKISCG